MTLDYRTPESKEKTTSTLLTFQEVWGQYEKDHPFQLHLPKHSQSSSIKKPSSPFYCPDGNQNWPLTWTAEFLILVDKFWKELVRNPAAVGASIGVNLFLDILLG